MCVDRSTTLGIARKAWMELLFFRESHAVGSSSASPVSAARVSRFRKEHDGKEGRCSSNFTIHLHNNGTMVSSPNVRQRRRCAVVVYDGSEQSRTRESYVMSVSGYGPNK